MSRRDNGEVRCGTCHMHASLCVCASIPRLVTKTRLLLYIHRCEDRKPTNTGKLATLCLPNSQVIVRGHRGQASAPFVQASGQQAVFLFPYEGAVPLQDLAREHVNTPITLIVPDGTWRQAWKVRNRVPGLLDVPCVSLPAGPPSIYRLRAEAHHEGLATMEAIARAFGILEGQEVQQALESIFQTMVERTLWARGLLSADKVWGGIPAGAMRHDPESGILGTKSG